MKRTINELVDRIKSQFNFDAELDDRNEQKIFIWHDMYWGADDEKSYVKQEKLLDKLRYSSKLFDIWCWCDISGYNYWMLDMKESNYVSIDIVIHKSELTEKEFNHILTKLDHFDDIINNNMLSYETI